MVKIRYNRLFILGIAIYVIFNIAINVLSITVKTQTLESEDIELKITTKGLIVRDEYLVESDSKGDINYIFEENEKIRKNDEVAFIVQDKISEDKLQEIENLEKEIENLEQEKLEVSHETQKIRINQNIESKNQQIEVINNVTQSSIDHINTPMSGVISYKYDGYENKYSLKNISSITKEDIENGQNELKYIENTNSVSKGDTLFRIIKLDSDYIVIAVDESENEILKEKNILTLHNENVNIECKIDDITKNDDYYIYKLKIQGKNEEIYDTRVEEFDIIYKQGKCIKVHKESIIDKDGKKGVYIVDSETRNPRFVEITGNLYEDEEYIYIDYYQNNYEDIKTIDLYDEIIINPNYINTKITVK